MGYYANKKTRDEFLSTLASNYDLNDRSPIALIQDAIDPNDDSSFLEYELFKEELKMAICGDLLVVSALLNKIKQTSKQFATALVLAENAAQMLSSKQFGFKTVVSSRVNSVNFLSNGSLFYFDYLGSKNSLVKSLSKIISIDSFSIVSELRHLSALKGIGLYITDIIKEIRLYGHYGRLGGFESVSFDTMGDLISRKTYCDVSAEMVTCTIPEILPTTFGGVIFPDLTMLPYTRLGLRFFPSGKPRASLMVKFDIFPWSSSRP